MRCPMLQELPPPLPDSRTGWPWTEECKLLPDRMPDGQTWALLSMVTPSFNQEDCQEETIRSVLLQGYPNLEYIVIDGRSGDRSLEIIQKYERWLTRWVSEPDGGQSEAINKGWDYASGEIVVWINSDDLYCPSALREVADAFVRSTSLGLLHGDCICINPSSTELGLLKRCPVVVWRLLTAWNTLLQPSTFFRRSLLERAGGLDHQLHYVLDYDLWVRMLVTGCVTQYIPSSLSKFRLHGSAKTVAEEFQMKLEVKKVLDRTCRDTALPDEYRKWERTVYSNYHWSIGEVYLKDRKANLARQEFWQAIRIHPMRPASVIVLALLLDTGLGTRPGSHLQHLRWRLPYTSNSNTLWEK